MKQTRIDFAKQKAAGERYYQRWKALQQQGVKPAVVSKRDDPALWRAWQEYYRAHGLWPILQLMNDGRDEKTVPTLNPLEFEPLVFVEVGPDRRVKDD